LFKKILIGLVTGVANGLFGAGGGTILVPSLQKFLKIKTHKSHATAIAVILPLTLLSVFFYRKTGNVDWAALLWISLGGTAGGFLGAKLLNRLSSKWLHRIFGLFMMVAAVRMVFS